MSGVRIGKFIELTIDAPRRRPQRRPARQVDDMCRKLLANPIIEDYTFEISERVTAPR